MIKLVVFDWNGTLIADLEAVTFGCNAKLKFYGHPPITSKKYREIFDIPAYRLYEKLGIDAALLNENIAEASAAFHDAYELRAAKIRTRRGARQLLQFLETRDVSKIIFSNHTAIGIHFQLERLKIASYFDIVLANDDRVSAHVRGKKARLVTYLKTHTYKPDEVLIIGDTVEEISIGKDLELHTVAITEGYNTSAKLRQAKPDYTIHNLNDLIPIIQKL